MSEAGDRNVEWEYLQWLNGLAGTDQARSPYKSYSLLAEQMFRKPFDWTVLNDDNRTNDGLYLRERFHQEYGGLPIVGPPSFLEVLIVLAEKLEFDMDEYTSDLAYWFYQLLENAHLEVFTDQAYLSDYVTASEVDNILEMIMQRDYNPDGSGGFFPLQRPKEDQRGVELWFQLGAYVLELSGYQ